MTDYAIVYAVNPIIESTCPNPSGPVDGKTDNQFFLEFLVRDRHPIGGRIVQEKAAHSPDQHLSVRGLGEALHTFVLHFPGRKRRRIDRPDPNDVRMPVQDTLLLGGDPDTSVHIGINPGDIRMGIHFLPVRTFQIRKHFPAAVPIEDADTGAGGTHPEVSVPVQGDRGEQVITSFRNPFAFGQFPRFRRIADNLLVGHEPALATRCLHRLAVTRRLSVCHLLPG